MTDQRSEPTRLPTSPTSVPQSSQESLHNAASFTMVTEALLSGTDETWENVSVQYLLCIIHAHEFGL